MVSLALLVALGVQGERRESATPESQWRSLRTTNAIERMQLEFRRGVKTQAALPNEGAVLQVFFGLWISGQMKLHCISGHRDMGRREKS